MIKGFRISSITELGKKQLKKNTGSDRKTKIVIEGMKPLQVAYYFNYKGVLKALQRAIVNFDVIKLGVKKFMTPAVEGKDYKVGVIEDER